MKLRWLRLATTGALLSLEVLDANANCAPHNSVTKSFQEAKAVYMAKAVRIRTAPCTDSTNAGCKIEYATLQVIETWKGARIGDLIRVRTRLETGETSSVFEKVQDGSTGKILRGAGIWIIYQSYPEPIELDACGLDKSIEFGGANDLATLYRLKAGTQGKD